MKFSGYRPALIIQTAHLLLCALWNVVGLYLINQGQAAIGPTASWTTIIVVLALLVLLWWSIVKHWFRWYTLFSITAVFFAALAIYGGFTKSPDLWPSEFWRFAGIAVNSVGVIGFVFAIVAAGKDGLSFQGLAGR